MNRRLPVSIALAAVAAASVLLAVPTAARAAGTDPAANIPASFPASCRTAPTASDCEDGVVAQLDHARAVLGQPAYALPAGFGALPPASQLVVLSNLDRALYGLAPTLGTNATLNAAAQVAATQSQDPTGPSVVDGISFRGWSANVAMGYPSALEAYYGWMYDDGPGGPNYDCPAGGGGGCWGHRHDTLIGSGSAPLSMGVGAAVVNGSQVFTELYWYGAGSVSTIPVVTGASPSSGPAGTVVTITGYGLGGAPAVRFGTLGAAPVSSSATSLQVPAPAGGAGSAALQVVGRSSDTGVAGGVSTAVAPATFTFAGGGLPTRTLSRTGAGSTAAATTGTALGAAGATAEVPPPAGPQAAARTDTATTASTTAGGSSATAATARVAAAPQRTAGTPGTAGRAGTAGTAATTTTTPAAAPAAASAVGSLDRTALRSAVADALAWLRVLVALLGR